MIFVTLGTQDKPFNRLLSKIELLIDSGVIKEEVVVQAGYTKFKSDKMKIFDLLPMDKFDKLIDECNLLITHGGVGSIIGGLKKNKKVIAVPRLSKYKEHVNDHQLQIIKNFDKSGYIIGVFDLNDLEDALKRVKKFKPSDYHSNTHNMVSLVEKYIDL